MITLDLSILNQKGTPMFYSDITANRPAAGIVGRIFIATDSPFGIFRDTGTGWDQVSSAGGATIYTADGTLTGNRTVSSGGFNLTFTPQTTFLSSLIPSTSASSYSVLGSNTLTYAAGFSSSNIGNVYSANGAINAQRFSGSATFAQSNLASAMVSVNSIDFTSAGSTITMTQSTGIRAMTGHQSQIQFQGTNSGTISHAAVSQNLGFYRPPAATGTLTITNAYGHLINALDDYGAGFTFTNRWGIYQAGASDLNYFAANVLIGTTTNAGFKLQVVGGAGYFSGNVLIGSTNTGADGLGLDPNLNVTFVEGSGQSIVNLFRQLNTAGGVLAAGYKRSLIGGFASSNSASIAKAAIVVGENSGSIAFYSDSATTVPNGTDITPTSKMILSNNGTLLINSFDFTGNRTNPFNVLTLTANNPNAPFEKFGGAILFNNSSYVSGVVSSARIRSFISDGGGLEGGGFIFETTPTAGGTLTPTLTIKYTQVINIANMPTSAAGLVSGDLYRTANVVNIVP